ncbi:MAG: hypothetical protein WDM81_06550 [Rhizomicrobium sp.]
MTLAILCSGQGRQHPGMFALTGDAPEAAPLFAHAARLLGARDPRTIVHAESSEVLHRDRAGQILCTLQALAAAAALREAMPASIVVAGYSVGEVAAWGVAGLLDMTDTLDLVARRGGRDGCALLARGRDAVRARPLPRRRRRIVRAPRCRGRDRQSRRCLRDRRKPRGPERPSPPMQRR